MSQLSLFDFGVLKKRKPDESVSDQNDSSASEQPESSVASEPQAKKQKTATNASKPTTKLRMFQPEWLKQFEWLEYDDKTKRMFCKVCRAANSKNSFTKEGAGALHFSFHLLHAWLTV